MQYGFGNTFDRSLPRLDKTFSPLDYNPTFWFDYNQYPLGALAGGEVDETGDYSITPFNSAIIGNDGVNNALETNGVTNSYCVSYGNTFASVLSQPHTILVFYKPKVVNVIGLGALFGADGGGYQYSVVHIGQKLRLFIRIGGVDNTFETSSNVITTTDYLSIAIRVQQSGVEIIINGINQPLAVSAFTSILANLSYLSENIYVGARNSNGTINLPSNGFIGDHLLFPSILTDIEITQLLTYFV